MESRAGSLVQRRLLKWSLHVSLEDVAEEVPAATSRPPNISPALSFLAVEGWALLGLDLTPLYTRIFWNPEQLFLFLVMQSVEWSKHLIEREENEKKWKPFPHNTHLHVFKIKGNRQQNVAFNITAYFRLCLMAGVLFFFGGVWFSLHISKKLYEFSVSSVTVWVSHLLYHLFSQFIPHFSF